MAAARHGGEPVDLSNGFDWCATPSFHDAPPSRDVERAVHWEFLLRGIMPMLSNAERKAH